MGEGNSQECLNKHRFFLEGTNDDCLFFVDYLFLNAAAKYILALLKLVYGLELFLR